MPNIAEDNCHTAPDNILDDNQYNHSPSDCAINDIVLGVPFAPDLGATHGASDLPAIGPVITVTCNSQPTEPLCSRTDAGCMWDGDNWSCSYNAVFVILVHLQEILT